MSAPPAISRLVVFRQTVETFAVGAAGGLTFGLLGLPAGFLSGAIMTVATAALFGRPMQIPRWLARVIFVVIGISLGSVVTPATLQGMATYPVSILVLIVAMALITLCAGQYLRVVHGFDKASAYLAAAPGGLSQVLAVGAEVGADLRAIAIVQTIRVVIVAVGLPAGLALFGFVGPTTARVGVTFDPRMLDELAILVVASTTAAIIAYRLRFPGGLLFGSMMCSAILHGTGWIHAALPWWVATTVMIALGTVTGSRFANLPPRLFLNFIAAAFGSFTVAVTIAAIFATLLMSLLPLRVAEVMMAFAPGAVDAMMLLALALHLDPVYVGAHHLTRIFLVSFSMPLLARFNTRAAKPPVSGDSGKKPPPTFQD